MNRLEKHCFFSKILYTDFRYTRFTNNSSAIIVKYTELLCLQKYLPKGGNYLCLYTFLSQLQLLRLAP